ncbi:MAG: DUF5677 domain-containing protein [bacterium]
MNYGLFHLICRWEIPLIKKLINKIKPEIERIGSVELSENTFELVLSAALVKSYGLTRVFINAEDSSDAYFMLGSLRGVCEDFIVLAFLQKMNQEDRNAFVSTFMKLKLQESLDKQCNFFKKEKKDQIILNPSAGSDAVIAECKEKIKEIGERTEFWKGNSMPRVSDMAKCLGLQHFYQYLYALSSETVHFSPRMLFRMGWGGNAEQFQFSTKNFAGYYQQYGMVYSSLLFIRFSREFKDTLKISNKLLMVVTELECKLNDMLRWPEHITHEEMNLRAPDIFQQVVYRRGIESLDS